MTAPANSTISLYIINIKNINEQNVKLWISNDKKIIAFYTNKACVDLILEKEGVDLSGGKVKLEFYEGDKLVKEKICGPGDLINIDEILSFLSKFNNSSH